MPSPSSPAATGRRESPTTASLDPNPRVACNLASDAEAIEVDRVTNAGELFFKMLMKTDANIVWGRLCAPLDARTATLEAKRAAYSA